MYSAEALFWHLTGEADILMQPDKKQKKKAELEKRRPDNGDVEIMLPPSQIRVSVRNLVEFILRHGDIDNRYQSSSDNAMQEGSRIHRMLQRRMGAEYEAEVPLKFTLPTEEYVLVIEGRADGIIHHENQVIIDEIKGTYRDLEKLKDPMPLHIAQAKCYAYIYSLQQDLREIRVRMTYCNIETEQVRYFYEDYTFGQLAEWFGELIKSYRRWADYSCRWQRTRQSSIAGLEFPYPYRDGQRELVANVYRTIYHKKKLFLEAPTGVGKTISTIYPAVQAMGQGMGERLFYLTAKTITRTVADETFALLRDRGLHFKSVILTAKDKICLMEQADCNPEQCPYAKGHFDRINDALFDLLTSQESFTREKITEYAKKYQVCPFEMCLDISLFSDAVICDYNYLFDPHVYLKRFFSESSGGNYIFLIDEAHNLLERGREMYSAPLYKKTFLDIRRELKQTVASEMYQSAKNKDIVGQMTLEMTLMSKTSVQPAISPAEEYAASFAEETAVQPAAPQDDRLAVQSAVQEAAVEETGGRASKGRNRGGKSVLVRQGYADQMIHYLGKCNEELLALKRDCDGWRTVETIDGFMKPLMRLHSVMEDYLSEQEESPPDVREPLLDFYFEIGHFLEIYELVDENYVKYTQLGEDGDFLIKLFCVNPSENLKSCMARGRSTILFSATFLPIQYYKRLLGGEKEDYEVYARSVFHPEKRALFIASDVTSKYTRRSDGEYYKIARYIDEVVKNRYGNYMVFCPSYAFMHRIYDIYLEHFAGEGKECLIQNEYMSEREREEFLARFRGSGGSATEETMLIGFCVLGGIFSEGIDLKNDSLIGAIIVGTGLPQVCCEREILKGYFDAEGDSGFDFSYRYPGMNKVLQAAGRVIRTVEDVGIVALLDERFLQFTYRRLFPREWEQFETVTVETIAKRVERFWDSWFFVK